MKNKRESGTVVVEATIVVTLVMIVITIMMYVGMVLYQQTLVSVMANQTAANIAQIYSNNLKDPFTGYVSPYYIYQSVTYSNMKTDAYMSVIEQKADVFAQYRLKSSRILTNGNTSVDVEIVKKPNELLRSQIVVTVRDHYDVPLVGMFGTSGLVEFASSGRADCVDVLEYINGVEAIGDPEDSNVSFLPDSRNCTITFVPDGDNPGNFSVQTVLSGHSIMTSNPYTHCVMPPNPQKGSLEFAGWYTESGKMFTASTQVEENITVYGKWKCQVTLEANGNGATVNGKAKDTIKVICGNRTALPTPVRSGYTFLGWFDANGNPYRSNDTRITNNVTLNAKWTCAHPGRYESGRTGSACDGGKIYYKCTQCGADVGEGSYGGLGHNYTRRCNVKHSLSTQFNGTSSGGCGGYHQANTYCSKCGVTHGRYVYYYHAICGRCTHKASWWWCANNHCQPKANNRSVVYIH